VRVKRGGDSLMWVGGVVEVLVERGGGGKEIKMLYVCVEGWCGGVSCGG
jgi:hypothetical protein